MTAPVVLGALLAVALFLAAGWGVILLLPGLARCGWAVRLGLAYLLGVAWIGLFLYAASHFAGADLGRPLVLFAAALPLAAGLAAALPRWLRRKRGACARPPRRGAWSLGWAALALLAVLVSAAVLANALTHPLEDWDGRMTWSAQARYVRAAGTVDAEVLRFPKSFVSHPRYPLLMPLVQVAALEVAGSDDERVFRAVYALFFPLLVLLGIETGRRWAGPRAALLAGLVLLTVPWIPFDREGGATGAYSDLPLACFLGGGLLLLLRGRPRVSHGLAGGLLLAAALLTKNEGLPESLAVLGLAGASAALALGRRRGAARARLAATLAAGALLLGALLLLVSWRAAIPSRYDEGYFETFSLSVFARHLISARTFAALPEIARRMLDVRSWGLLGWLAPVLVLAARPSWRRPPAAFLAVAAVAPIAVAWAAYAQVANPVYYAAVTWNRILLHGCVPGIGLLALTIRRLLSHDRSRNPPPLPPPSDRRGRGIHAGVVE